MKRVFWILFTPLVAIFLLALLVRFLALPSLEAWALHKVETYSAQKLPVQIKAQSLHFYFLKPSVALENIEVRSQGELQKAFDVITISSVRAHMDLFQLITGRLQMSAVVVDSPVAQVNLDAFASENSQPEPLPIDQIFSISEKIPLERVFVQNMKLDLHSVLNKLQVQLQNSSFLVTNMGKNLTAKADIPSLKIDQEGVGNVQGGLDGHLYLTRQSLKIIQLRLHLNDSEIVARGELLDFKNVTLKPQGVLSLSAQVILGDIYNEIRRVRPLLKIPRFEGKLKAESEIKFKGLDQFSGKVQLKTEKVIVDQFQVGDASLEGTLKEKTFKISEFKVTHPAGTASLDATELTLDHNLRYRTKIHVNSLDMQNLFVSLGLKNIPVSGEVSGTLPCQGQFGDPLQLECEADIRAKKLWIRSQLRQEKSEILALDEMAASGSVKLNAQAVDYKAKVSLSDNTGTSEGHIDFDKGFLIQFKTDRLDFKNVRNLAHLKLIGAAGIEGSTEGNSDAATFDMKLNASDFVFEDFQLGNLGGDLKYRQGHLIFENLEGAQNKSQFLASLDVDLAHDQINGQVKMPVADLADIAKIFERIYKFPLAVSGLGKAEARFHGSLDFWKMSYQLDSQFKKFSFGPDNFDSLAFNVESKDGDMRTNKVLVQKNNSVLTADGGISPEKNIHLNIEAKNWKLEESDLVNKISSGIFGVMNGTAEVKGPVNSPLVTLKSTITDTVIEELEIPQSNLTMKIDRNHLESEMNLFGERIRGDILVPLGASTSPLKIKVKTVDWSFSSLLSLLGAGNLVNDYDSSLTSEIDLTSESGSLSQATGLVSIKDFFLKRANLNLRNSQPIEIRMNNGKISLKDFDLKGPRNQLHLKGENFTTDNLNVNLAANVELRLLHMFLPALEDVGGEVKTTATFTGPAQNPKVLGNLTLNNGYIKIKGFPHPFEKLQADASFSHTRILINSIRGQLGGGNLTGDGSVLINGPKDFATTINGRLEGTTLNVPDHVRTSGSADVVLSGKWFPFTLAGTYRVSSAFVDKEFGDDGATSTGIRPSVYLPKVLKLASFEPILLDLQIILDKNVVVKNTLIDGSVTGNIQVKGPPQTPILLGKINFEKNSKLIFKDKIFEVLAGQVQFTNPNEIDPDIYLSAQSRVNDYDVSLLVQGTAKNMGIHVSSVPPLSDQDIISLLALGVTSTKIDQNVQSREQQAQSSYEIGAAIIGAPINKKLESTFGLNLQFSSSYDTTRNINVPKVTLSRKLSPKVTASASRIMGDQSAYDVKLQYLINHNVSAIGSFEKKDSQDTTLRTTEQDSQSFFGLDLEFKREFK